MIDHDPITFDWENYKFIGITKGMVKTWEQRYPDIDVIEKLTKAMPEWLENKKDCKKAHKHKWRSFILRWLKRDQIKAVL
jgi:hypothetical protein